MEPASVFSVLSDHRLPLVVAGVAMAIALLATIIAVRLRHYFDAEQEGQKQRLETLWREVDELRVEQFNGPTNRQLELEHLDPEHLAIEKAAYDRLWPLICALHDKLGSFLRAVETGEPANDSRLSARNAALEARTTLNNVRPFCHERIDDLATQLIDTEIKAHLTGCQYQDLLRESPTGNGNGERERLHQKFRMLYDSDARELMNQLIEVIRRRMIKRGSG